jgi:hypothetical protein
MLFSGEHCTLALPQGKCVFVQFVDRTFRLKGDHSA